MAQEQVNTINNRAEWSGVRQEVKGLVATSKDAIIASKTPNPIKDLSSPEYARTEAQLILDTMSDFLQFRALDRVAQAGEYRNFRDFLKPVIETVVDNAIKDSGNAGFAELRYDLITEIGDEIVEQIRERAGILKMKQPQPQPASQSVERASTVQPTGGEVVGNSEASRELSDLRVGLIENLTLKRLFAGKNFSRVVEDSSDTFEAWKSLTHTFLGYAQTARLAEVYLQDPKKNNLVVSEIVEIMKDWLKVNTSVQGLIEELEIDSSDLESAVRLVLQELRKKKAELAASKPEVKSVKTENPAREVKQDNPKIENQAGTPKKIDFVKYYDRFRGLDEIPELKAGKVACYINIYTATIGGAHSTPVDRELRTNLNDPRISSSFEFVRGADFGPLLSDKNYDIMWLQTPGGVTALDIRIKGGNDPYGRDNPTGDSLTVAFKNSGGGIPAQLIEKLKLYMNEARTKSNDASEKFNVLPFHAKFIQLLQEYAR